MPDIEIDGQDVGDNWFDFLKEFFKDIGSGVTLLVGGFSDTVTELTKVFPFSIPITLTLIMQMFSAPPQAPKYELPIKLEKLGIDEVIIIDLSDFGVVSIISRTFLTVIYCMALYKLTLKIITAKKGG